MLNKSFLALLLFLPLGAVVYGQKQFAETLSDNGIIANYGHLSPQQLLDTANYYYNRNSIDTALVCYNLFISIPVKDTDIEGQKRVIEASIRVGNTYWWMCDYRKAYELYIKILDLCEKYHNDLYKSRVYTNIGNIYYRFKKYDMAKSYYSKSLNLCTTNADSVLILNNLGSVEMERNALDSAHYFLDESLKISKTTSDAYLQEVIYSTIASVSRKSGQRDSAFYYFRLSLNEARKNHKTRFEAEISSELSKLFFEINETDSVRLYIHLSNTLAKENDFLDILVDNYLTLSKVEESKGRIKNALSHFKTYAALKDSISDVEVFSNINQLQRLYEVSKTNEQIAQLAIEQQIKERTIRYQQIIWLITLGVLLLVSIVLLYVFFQKRTLNKAYKMLFEKNMEIIGLQESSRVARRFTPEEYPKKYPQNALTDNIQNELLDKILALMEDTSIICDPKFSVNRLAELTQSNQNYVSRVINNALKKSFRSFLNSYRIREAQRLFSELDMDKYTIESIASRVGFKSSSTFRAIFKEITGVSPVFYLKSMQKQQK